MLLLTFQFIFVCFSINRGEYPQIFQEEVKKIDELEKKLNETLDLLYEFVQKKEQSINNSTSKYFESQIEELIKHTEQIANNSKPIANSNLFRIPLSINKVEYNELDQQKNGQYDYQGYFVPGDYPTVHYIPAITFKNAPHGLIFQHLTNNPCEANHFKFSFRYGAEINSIYDIFLNQNSTTYHFDDIKDFDLLIVEVLSKFGNSPCTCIPEFVLFSKDDDDH